MSYDLTRPSPDGTYPLEPKVTAATSASYLATLLLTGLLNVVQDEDHALLLGFLPEWLETLLLPLIPALLTLAAGYAAKHQHRRPAGVVGQ